MRVLAGTAPGLWNVRWQIAWTRFSALNRPILQESANARRLIRPSRNFLRVVFCIVIVAPGRQNPVTKSDHPPIIVMNPTKVNRGLIILIFVFLQCISAFATVTINTQPTALTTAVDGSKVTIQVNALSGLPLTYRWWKDGTALSTMTSTSNQLVFSAVKGSDAGSYYAQIYENGINPVNTASAILVVNVRPKITATGQPKALTLTEGSMASFSVTLDSVAATRGTPPFNYIWQYKTGTIWSDIHQNANSPAFSDVFSIPAVQLAHAGSYRVVIQNAAGSITSTEAVLKVNSRPVLSSLPGKIVTVFQSGGGTTVTEGGATDTYSVVLSAPPSAGKNVTVTPAVTSPFFTDTAPAVSTDVVISPANAVFNDANWNTPVVFTVTANDDAVANPFLAGAAPLNVRSAVIGHVVTGTDTDYAGAQISNFLCSVTDNETTPRILVTENSSTSMLPGSNGISVVTEGGATDTFTVTFAGATPPASDVTVNLTAGARITTNPASLTFTSANYATPQTVTITAVNDSVFQGVQFATVSFATVCADGTYNGLTAPILNVRVNDNDDAGVQGVTLISSGGDNRVVEGGMNDEMLVVLNKAPSGNVYFTQTGTAPGLGAVPDLSAPGNLLFTTANWFIPQRVNVSALDDLFVEPTRSVSFNYTVSGGGYATSVGPINVIIGDNDLNSTAGVRVVQSGTTDVTEGGATDSFDVTLAGAPTNNVSITLSVNPGAQASISGATLVANTLTFTPANWNVAQTVTVTATDDLVTEGPHTAAVSFNLGIQSDARYTGMVIADVPVNITDNDNGPMVVITQSGGSTTVAEGGPIDYFSVAFSGPTAPTSPVTVTLSRLGTQINAPSPATLTFNNLNWKVPQTVFLTAFNDAVSEGVHGDAVTFSTASADGTFNVLAVPNLPVTIYDNDSASAGGVILITETNGSTRLVEGGIADTIYVSLLRAPTATVTLTPTLTPTGEVTGTSPLTFTTANWNVPQPVAISAPTDAANEGVQTVTLFYTADASGGFTIQDVSSPVSIVIADTSAGAKKAVLTQTGANTSVTEDGPTAANGSPNSKDVYKIALNIAPTADVTITPVASSPGQVTFSPTSVTFTPINFATPQDITVTAVSNTISEPDETLNIDHNISSTDAGYNNVPLDPLSLNVADDDATVGRIAASRTGGGTLVLREDTGTDMIDVSLSGPAPTANVTVNLAIAGSQVQFFSNGLPATGISLTFTPANYSTAQQVTLISVDDTLYEGLHSDTILFTSAPGSPLAYTDLSTSLPVTILDNESASRSLISIIETDAGTRVIEGGMKDTFSVVLRRAPTANVMLTPVYNIAQITLSLKALTFTSANWNIPQLVTVMAVDDAVLEGSHSASIVYSAGGTGGFVSTDMAALNVQIGDNEGVVPALPPALNIVQGVTGMLKVAAMGSVPLTYQWYKEGNPIPGAKTASLTIKGLDAGAPAAAEGPGNYSVEITNAQGSVRSNATAVRVIRKPSILTDLPATRGFTLPPAANLTLDVVAHTATVPGADYGTLRYQWQKDGKNIGDAVIVPPAADPRVIAGTMTKTLTITPVSWLDRGSYKVIISNEVGSITSKATTVSVTSPPVIVTQPVNATGPTGGSAKFTVVAGGSTPLNFQWSYSPDNIAAYVNITTGKAAMLTITKLAASNTGYYKCRVSHPTLGFVDTIPAFLQVDNPPVVSAPLSVERVIANAAMAAGSALVQFTNPATVTAFKIGLVVIHPNLPAGTIITDVNTANNTITLSSTNTTGLALNINAGNPMDIVGGGKLEILTGNNIHLKVSVPGSVTNTPANPLIYTWQKNNADILGGPNSDTLILPTTSTADSGTYRCVVKNLVGTANSAGLLMNVQTAPSIAVQPPANSTAVEESSLTLTFTAAGSPLLTYKWQRNLGTTLSPVWQDLVPAKTTATLTFPKTSLADSGDYRCIVTNKVGTVTTITANITVTRIPDPVLGAVTGLSRVPFYPETGITGEKVRLYGRYLSYASEVKFGNDYATATKATFVIESDNSLLITIPGGAPTTAAVIQVKNRGAGAVPVATVNNFTRTLNYSNGYRTTPMVIFTPPATYTDYTLPNATIVVPTSGVNNLNGDTRPTTNSWYVMTVPKISNISITVTGLVFGTSVADPDLYLYTVSTAATGTFYGPDGVKLYPNKATLQSISIGTSSVAMQTTTPNQEILFEVRGFGILGFVDDGPYFMSVVVSPVVASESGAATGTSSVVTARKYSKASADWTSSVASSVASPADSSAESTAISFGGSDTKSTEPVVLWNDSLNQSPTSGTVVASFTMSLESGGESGDDQFAWQVTNPDGDPLLALWVNAADGSIRSVQPDGVAHPSIQHMTPGGGAHRFEITVDAAAGTWITMMDGVPVTAPVPLPAGARFGDISAVWDLGADGQSSGASIIFDDFAVEAEQVP